MNCFTVEISEPSGNILEIESCINQVSNSIIIEQTNNSNELTISQCMAQLPSDINDIIVGQINNHIVSGSGISLSEASGYLIISTTGLQPSGIYASGIHSHVSSDVTDFDISVSGLLPITNIFGGQNISIINSGTSYTISVSGQLGLTTEEVDDRVNSLLYAGTGIYIDYDDQNNLLYINTSGLQPSGNYSLVGHNHEINEINNLQITLDSKQPSGIYASGIHSHIASDITNFNNSVSGLLPITDISGGTNISIINSGSLYTISASGLQPSGNYSTIGHTHSINDVAGLQNELDNKQPSGSYASAIHNHLVSDITNFGSGVSGLLPVIDISAGNGIGITNNSGDYTVSVTGTFGLTGEEVDDRVNSLLNSGYGINLQYNDNNNLLTVSISGLQPSGDYSLTGHSHVIEDISGLQNILDNKQNLLTNTITGSGSANHIAYWTSTSGLSYDENQLYWDSSSNELGIGTNNPSRNIDVISSGGTSVGIKLNSIGTGGRSYSFFSTNNGSSLGGGKFGMYDDTAQASRFVIDSGGNIGIGTNSPAYKLDVVGIGNFSQNLLINNIPVSTSGHTHTASNISDFITSVSGLLPVKNILGSGYINVTSNTGNYTISVSGLQPSGNYSAVGHTHTSSDITDFDSSVGGLITVKDLVAGNDISISSMSGIYTINSTTTSVDEADSLVTTVFNKTGSAIPKMTVVYINGGQGDMPTITLAIANAEATSSKTYGITAETIDHMSMGKVIVEGALNGLNTDQFNPTAPQGDVNGTVVYLSPTISGGITTTKTYAPDHLVSVGTIVRTHQNEGIIEVRIQNGFELEELHNVAVTGALNGQFLQYNSSSGLWVPTSSGNFSTLSVNNTGVVVSSGGASGYLSKFNSNNSIIDSLIYDNGTNIGIGTTTPSGQLHVIGTGIFSSGIVFGDNTLQTTAYISGQAVAASHGSSHATNGSDPVPIITTTPSQVTSNQNDYVLPSGDVVRLSTDATRTFTGFQAINGAIKTIYNVGNFDIRINHQDINSTAENRVLSSSGGDLVLAPNDNVTLVYDNTTQRWRTGGIIKSVSQVSIYEFTRVSSPPEASGSLGSYTWSLPANAKLVEIFMLGGGGGGGSGRRGASATNRYGGGGGGSAGSILVTIDASLITTPLTMTIAAGGGGGASVTTDDTNGNSGGGGGTSTLTFNGSTNTLFRAFGGLGAAGGTNSTGTGGTFTSNNASTFRGSAGQNAALSNLTTTVPGDRAVNGPVGIPGAAGGSISTGDVVFTPGSVRNDAPYFVLNNAQTGADTSGGIASITQNAESGSNAASYGYGGCGGGASANGFASGAGGNGGDGYVRITVWY